MVYLKFLLLIGIFYFVNSSSLSKQQNETKLEPLMPSEVYTKYLNVDEDQKDMYRVYWKTDNTSIVFELHCKTTGWVAIGISPSGGMRGADITIGWVDSSGKAFIKDTYSAESEQKPLSDKQNDLTLLDGKELNGYTILKFKRDMNTCDKLEDVEIKEGTSYLIFAWHPEDPITGNEDWKYHTPAGRRTKTVLLVDSKNELVNALEDDTFTADLKIRNYLVPTKRTTYYCDIFRMPSFDSDVHMTQFEIIIEKKNLDIVHHIIVYECTHDFFLYPGEEENIGQECGPVKYPEHIAQKCRSKMLVIWGVGGNYNNTFPKIAGYPIYKRENNNQYYLVEMHYDNPYFTPNRYDNTVIRFYYTKQLRKHELGLMGLGTDPGSQPLHIIVPPKATEVKYTSFCYSECTEKFIPEDGIYAVSSLLHTHLAGRSVRTSLIRNDKVINHIFDNPKYDFNFQYIVDIEPLKLSKGDMFITECTYSTMDRDNFTLWGYGTYEEMCGSFFYYYPRIPTMDICSSEFSHKALYDFHRQLMKENLIPHVNLNDNEVAISNANIIEMMYSNKTVITDEVIKRYSNFMSLPHNHLANCWSVSHLEDAIFKKEKAFYYPKETFKTYDSCTINPSNNAIMMRLNSFFSIFFLVMTMVFIIF